MFIDSSDKYDIHIKYNITINMCEKYILAPIPHTQLIELMAEQKKERWEEMIISIDLTHNSRKAWKTIKNMVMAYADDITITSTHTSTSAAKKYIQPYLHKVFAWTKQNNLLLNPDKTTCTLFTPDPAE